MGLYGACDADSTQAGRTLMVAIWKGVAMPKTGMTTVSYFLSIKIFMSRMSFSRGIWEPFLYDMLDLRALGEVRQEGEGGHGRRSTLHIVVTGDCNLIRQLQVMWGHVIK